MTDTATFDRIPVDKLDPDPTQVRKTKPTKAEQEGLRESVKALGILEPLVVRPNPDQAEHFLIVFGEQRWKAAKAAGLIDVPALIRTDLTEGEITANQAAENIVRTGMHPVDKWRAVAKLQEQGYDLLTAGRMIGVGEREARRLDKLGSLSPKLLDAMAGGNVPDDRNLGIIAMAPHAKQESALKRAGKWDDGIAWHNVANMCNVQRIERSVAIFDVEKAGVVFDQDFLAEPGSDEEWTTSDVAGFLKAQRAALDAEAKASNGHVEVIEWKRNQGSPAVPKGWRRIYAKEIPKRWKKDDPRKVFATVAPEGYQIGKIVREMYEPQAQSRKASADRAGGGAAQPAAPAPRDPITKAGQDLIAAAKREATKRQLPNLTIDAMLQVVLLAMTAKNVDVHGEVENSWRSTALGDLAAKLVNPDGTLIKVDEQSLIAIAADAVGRVLLFDAPGCNRSSGPVAEWIGAAVGAELALPAFDTTEFLKCCGSTALIEACEAAEMKPLKTASAMRKALEGKAPGWIPTTFGAPGPKIGPAGDPVDDWDDGEFFDRA